MGLCVEVMIFGRLCFLEVDVCWDLVVCRSGIEGWWLAMVFLEFGGQWRRFMIAGNGARRLAVVFLEFEGR